LGSHTVNVGMAMAAAIAINAITTTTSIIVKPLCLFIIATAKNVEKTKSKSYAKRFFWVQSHNFPATCCFFGAISVYFECGKRCGYGVTVN
jgi:hypothetical protein